MLIFKDITLRRMYNFNIQDIIFYSNKDVSSSTEARITTLINNLTKSFLIVDTKSS